MTAITPADIANLRELLHRVPVSHVCDALGALCEERAPDDRSIWNGAADAFRANGRAWRLCLAHGMT